MPGRSASLPAATWSRRALITLAVVGMVAPWLGAQMDWQRVHPSAWPTPIQSGAASVGMAYDAARGRVVLCSSDRMSNRDETWEWDGKVWTPMRPATRPRNAITPALAYDPHRKVTILFGAGANRDETWEWNGAAWTRRTPKNRPPGLSGHAIAYDAARRRLVIWGGGGPGMGATWEFDGTDWKNVTPGSGGPQARTKAAMTYDSTRARIVLHTGKNLWEWDGRTWTKVTPSTGNPPTNRSYQVVAYDSARRRMVMYGGHETWEWDGQKWHQRTTATSPPAAAAVAMVHDSTRARTVLLVEADTTYCNRMWEWDGTQWTQIPSNVARPASRASYGIAYDRHRRRAVVFGGERQYLPGYLRLNDTWEWDGTRWIRPSVTTSPPVRKLHALAYDVARRRTVLFGGWHGGQLRDTWEWDGKDWRNLTPSSGGPPGRYLHSMAYDLTRKRVIVFGGFNTTGALQDMWAWSGTNWTAIPVKTPPPTPGNDCMVYDSARRRLVLFQSGHTSADTWEWDGKNWANVTPATTRPPWRHHASIAYDPARQRTILHGGFQMVGTKYPVRVDLNDTWEWDGRAWTQARSSSVLPARRDDEEKMVFDHARGAIFHFGSIYYDVWHFAPRDLRASAHSVSVATGGQVAFALDAGAARGGASYIVLGCLDGATPRATRLGPITIPLVADDYLRLLLRFPGQFMHNQIGLLDANGRAAAILNVPKLPPTFAGLRFAYAFLAYRLSVEFVSEPVLVELTP